MLAPCSSVRRAERPPSLAAGCAQLSPEREEFVVKPNGSVANEVEVVGSSDVSAQLESCLVRALNPGSSKRTVYPAGTGQGAQSSEAHSRMASTGEVLEA